MLICFLFLFIIDFNFNMFLNLFSIYMARTRGAFVPLGKSSSLAEAFE